MYRASGTPDYPTAPPYNPEYPAHQNPYADHYPTGVIPPNTEYRQPLIQPPPYHDIVSISSIFLLNPSYFNYLLKYFFNAKISFIEPIF